VGGAATTDFPAIENNKTSKVVTLANLKTVTMRCIFFSPLDVANLLVRFYAIRENRDTYFQQVLNAPPEPDAQEQLAISTSSSGIMVIYRA